VTSDPRESDKRPAPSIVDAPAAVRVLFVGGSAEEALRVGELLAASRFLRFELEHAPTLAGGLERREAPGPDVLLIRAAEGRGDALASLLQARVRAPDLPIVVLGESEEEADALRALQRGARGYLTCDELSTRRLVTALEAALSSQRTIAQLHAARERARGLATRDQLTGLANRLCFQDRIVQAIAAARRNRHAVAIMFLDLDGFKLINDTLGHAVGDGFLRAIAQRLAACLRESDSAARLGGDEFGLLLTGLGSELDAAAVARKVLDSVAIPMALRNRSLVTTASLGIAVFPRDGSEPEDLVRKADTAMYQAKQRGRNRCEFYTEEMNAAIRRRATLESRLRTALEEGQFRVLYQPQFDLRRGRVVGAEALLRWEHPELGLLTPPDFLASAEEAGLIGRIGEWVLRTACGEVARWQERHPGFRVSVNAAPHQFRDRRFAEATQQALLAAGLHPELLEIEITEGSLVRNVGVMAQTLRELKQVGVSLSIDDFGTGYSALSYLKNLPIDSIKIDQSFVRNLTTDPADATLTETIIRMAQGLNLMTIAEGVETSGQLLLLGSYGCQRMQGYLFGRPMEAERLLRALERPAIDWVARAAPLED
jgi:diguanylate cyclase (GGDEF)-like protein